MRLFLGIFALLALAAVAIAETIPEGKEEIKFDTMLGTVTFGHAAHAKMEGVECTTCHHTHEGNEPIKACSECHAKKAGDAPSAKDALHAKCQGCHEERAAAGQAAGPGKKDCKACHVKG